ncbi:restriction endonuclease subunit S [Acinetobacter johnsonii]|uniref:restriction endonuclease subunit S n=1 Tax=Acinetobacter johnsonii TaxID=40214 RepID=UPI0032B3A96A
MSAPALRFKEFDGDWKSFSLLDLSSDKTLNNGVFNDQNKVGKGYKLINVLDMYIDRDIDESRLSLLDLSKQEFERNKVKYGDIFFTRSSLVKEGIAYSNVYLGSSNDITYDGHLIKLSPNLEQINSIFLNYGLKTSKVRKQLIQGGKTATMTTIGQKEIASTKIDVPFLQEQTKIASFLSAIDEKISQLTQKHQLLSQYKQGMMQKLFSQQIRFKADDGSEFEGWEETIFEKIGVFLKGKGISKADVVPDGKIPCIRYGELYTYYGEVISKIISSTNIEAKNLVLSKANDILIPASGETQIDIATASCVLQDNIALSGDLNIFRTKENGIFLSYLIRSKLKMQIAQLAQGNSVVHLYASQLKGVSFSLPCLEEQTKIANFLSAIDQKIEVAAQQIEQAKQWKKGLLQQMFV